MISCNDIMHPFLQESRAMKELIQEKYILLWINKYIKVTRTREEKMIKHKRVHMFLVSLFNIPPLHSVKLMR